MQFKEIIGHQKIKQQLKNILISQKISHGYLFDGPDGIGKSLLAHAFASAIVCDKFDGEPCGVCKNCLLSFGNSHPDIIELDLTIDKNGDIKESISVDAVRELKRDVYIKPFFSERKIYIINDAQKMTVEAQNALLKVFEEPPKFATFILLTNGLSKLLPTILSRGVVVKFQPLAKQELFEFAHRKGIKSDKTEILVNLSNGRISRMLAFVQDEGALSMRDEVLSGFYALVMNEKQNAINQLYLTLKDNPDKANDTIEFLTCLLSDIALLRAGNGESIVNTDKLDKLNQLSEKLNYHTLNNLLVSTMKFSEGQMKNQNYLAGIMNMLIRMWEEIHG